jgi:hypothetical protein
VAPSGLGYTWDDVVNTKGIGWLWTTDVTGLPGFSSDARNPRPDILDYWPAFGGTSASCPVAAGVAALILSIEPNLTNVEVRHFLERSAKDLGTSGRDDYYGWGRIDARAALDMVLAKRCDLNNNWKVDFDDLLILIDCWDTNEPSADIAPAAKRDGFVDFQDLELMMQYWQVGIPEPGLIARWKLDEKEGTIALDIAAENNGTLHSNPLWLPEGGMIKGALEFDGIDDYISTPCVLNPAVGTFSVFAWVKGGLPGQVIVSQKNGANWLIIDQITGCLITELKGSGQSAVALVSPTSINDGNWHRIGLSWDGINRILYVDDVEVAGDTQPILASSTWGLYIGAGKGLESNSFWSGMIDDVRIYDRVINP